MNKKAFLAGDTLVYVYCIIALAVIALLFSFLFGSLKVKEFLGIDEKEYSLDKLNPELKNYDQLDLYLNTKFKVENKETSLIELLPSYCYDQDNEKLSYIKRASSILLGNSKINVWCDLIDSKCNDRSINSAGGTRNLDINTNNRPIIINQYADMLNPTLFLLPFEKINICLEFESYLYKPEEFPEYIKSEKTFADKVEQISKIESQSVLGISNNKDIYLISPARYLWYYNVKDKVWCNLIEQNYQVCQKFLSEELIRCKGDYQCLR